MALRDERRDDCWVGRCGESSRDCRDRRFDLLNRGANGCANRSHCSLVVDAHGVGAPIAIIAVF
jgi:hypothetical protein